MRIKNLYINLYLTLELVAWGFHTSVCDQMNTEKDYLKIQA